MAIDVARVEELLGLRAKKPRRKKRRRPRPAAQAAPPAVNITVNVADVRRRPHGSTAPGRPGDYIANDRSRARRIGPSPG